MHAGAQCAHKAWLTVRIDVTRSGLPRTRDVRCWVGDEAIWARTLSPVVADGAKGVGATHRGGATRVGAAIVDACLIAGTVLVGPTADRANVAQTNVPQETVVVKTTSYCRERQKRCQL